MVEKTRHRKIPEIVSWSETVACKGANLRISYDVQNRRVYRKADEDQSGSQETELYYVLDGNRVIEERVYSDEDLKRDYWYGVYIDEPVFARADLNDDNDFSDSNEQFYYLHNTQYSVHAIIDTSGSIIEVYKNYQPYGAVEVYTGDGGDSDWWDGDETTGSLSSNYYLFTGRRYDPEADLMFYRNRMYSTSRGRFLQRDPVGYVDGLNLYAYVVNNPVMWTDPTGEGLWLAGALIAATAYGCYRAGRAVGEFIVESIEATQEAYGQGRSRRENQEDLQDDPTNAPIPETGSPEVEEGIEEVREAAEAGANIGGTGLQGPPATPVTSGPELGVSVANEVMSQANETEEETEEERSCPEE